MTYFMVPVMHSPSAFTPRPRYSPSSTPPEPSRIGRAESHGCVRRTNWDALRVAALVKPGTRVVFAE